MTSHRVLYRYGIGYNRLFSNLMLFKPQVLSAIGAIESCFHLSSTTHYSNKYPTSCVYIQALHSLEQSLRRPVAGISRFNAPSTTFFLVSIQYGIPLYWDRSTQSTHPRSSSLVPMKGISFTALFLSVRTSRLYTARISFPFRSYDPYLAVLTRTAIYFPFLGVAQLLDPFFED